LQTALRDFFVYVLLFFIELSVAQVVREQDGGAQGLPPSEMKTYIYFQ
jgi:hypothetical protein